MRFDESTFGGMNFIVNQPDFVGVFKVINYRDYNGFVLKLEVHKFLKSNQYILNNIIDQNQINPMDSKLLDRVSCERVHNDILNYKEVRQFGSYLNNTIRWAIQNNKDLVLLDILQKMQVVLNLEQLKQLYHIVESFGKNYFILESMFNMVAKLGEDKEPKDATAYADTKITDYVKKNKPTQSVQEVVQQQQKLKPKNEFETLLEYCFHPNLKRLVIHYALNYYRHIADDSCMVTYDNNIVNVKVPNVLPYSLSMDSNFFYSYILSNKEVPLNNITMYASKLIYKILFEEPDKFVKSPIYLMIFNLMVLVYSIRYLLELYPHIFDLQYEEIISNSNQMQQRIIQHYSNTFLKTLNLPVHENGEAYVVNYEITSFNIYKEWETKNDDLIKELSEKESHIIPVSQELFAKTVLGKLEDVDNIRHHPDFKFSNKKVIDITSLFKKNGNKKHSSGLIDPDNIIDPIISEDLILTNYLKYDMSEDGNITEAFKQLQKYLTDASSINFIKDLPKEIINLFPIIAKDILTQNTLPENLDNTYDYYMAIIDKLPHPENIRYTTILFIVFQIVIPYYYKFHNKTIFNDCLI